MAKTARNILSSTDLILFWVVGGQAYSFSLTEGADCSLPCTTTPTSHPTNPHPLQISHSSLLPKTPISSPYDPIPAFSAAAKLGFALTIAVFGLLFIGFAIGDALILRGRRRNGQELVDERFPESQPEVKNDWAEVRTGRLQEWREVDRVVREEMGAEGKGRAEEGKKE